MLDSVILKMKKRIKYTTARVNPKRRSFNILPFDLLKSLIFSFRKYLFTAYIIIIPVIPKIRGNFINSDDANPVD